MPSHIARLLLALALVIGYAPPPARPAAPAACELTPISTNTSWLLAHGPYVICSGGLTVAAGATLTVEPGVLVQAQKREEFEAVLKSVIAADVNASKKDRLANTIAQRRAKLLLKHADDLFN